MLVFVQVVYMCVHGSSSNGGPLYFWTEEWDFQHTSDHPYVLNVYFGVFWYVLFYVSDGCLERGAQE